MRALGMMSGTSLDGVDSAMIDTDGETICGFGARAWQSYDVNQAATLHRALGQWPGGADVAAAEAVIRDSHAQLAARFPDAQVIGFHGQTLAHDPATRRTHQAGDGAALARQTGRSVVWNFRSEDIRRGGEGAPLAPYFHFACARWAVEQGHLALAPVAFLNLGGVGNLTWVDPCQDVPHQAGACLAFDTGPANAPLNDLMRARRGVCHDAGGALAEAGHADMTVVERMLVHNYFRRPPPKSLDRNTFAMLVGAVAHLDDADAAATLVAIATWCVAMQMAWFFAPVQRLLVCGGGRHNAAMMAGLRTHLSCQVDPVEAAGLDGDMLEAQAFGWLAVRVLRGLPLSGPSTTGVDSPACGGRISHP